MATTVKCPKGHVNNGTRSLCDVCGEQLPFPAEWGQGRSLYERVGGAQGVFGIAVLLIGAIVALALFSQKGGKSTESSGGYTAAELPNTYEQPPPSTRDDWYRAVCQPGTINPGNGAFPGAIAGDTCISSKNWPIWIGVFSSSLMMENDVARLRGQLQTATGVDTDGNIWLFAVPGMTRTTALDPLRQYGFDVS